MLDRIESNDRRGGCGVFTHLDGLRMNRTTLKLMLARLGSRKGLLLSGTIAWLACYATTGLSDDERLLQTESFVYDLQPDWIGLRTEIPYTFINRTGRTIYLVNCNGVFSRYLERENEGEWKIAWSPLIPSCLSSPIAIEENAVFHDTLHVWGAPPDSVNQGPNFDLADPTGVYRIVWGTGLTSFDAYAQPFGPLIKLDWRVSNRFTLRR